MFVELFLILVLWTSFLTCRCSCVVGVFTTVNYAFACAQVVAKTRPKRDNPSYERISQDNPARFLDLVPSSCTR